MEKTIKEDLDRKMYFELERLESSFIDKTSKEIYEEYKYWCKWEKVKPVAKNVFGSAIMERFNVESRVIRVDGKCTRVYKK